MVGNGVNTTERAPVEVDLHAIETFNNGPLYPMWNELRKQKGNVVYLPNNPNAEMVNKVQRLDSTLVPIEGMYHVLDPGLIHLISGDNGQKFSAAMRPGGVFSFLPVGAELIFPYFLINQNPQSGSNKPAATTEEVDTLMSKGEAHTALRGTAAAAMTRGAVRELGERVASYASFSRAILEDKISSGESFNLVDLFGIVPHNTVSDLLGVKSWDTQEGWDKRMELAQIVADMGAYDDSDKALNAQIALFSYAAELIAGHRSETDDNSGAGDEGIRDLVKTLIDGTNKFPGLSDEALLPYYLLILFAGNETTRNALAGSAAAILADDENRHQVKDILDDANINREEALAGNNQQLEALINEMLRYVSPVQVFTREVMEDTELKGVKLSKGDVVALQYGAANHSPEAYDNPEEFQPLRFMQEGVPDGVAFGGHGPHHCIGQQLARSEMRRVLLDVFPVLIEAIDSGKYQIGDIVRNPDLFLAGFKSVEFAVAA